MGKEESSAYHYQLSQKVHSALLPSAAEINYGILSDLNIFVVVFRTCVGVHFIVYSLPTSSFSLRPSREGSANRFSVDFGVLCSRLVFSISFQLSVSVPISLLIESASVYHASVSL